MLRRDLNTGRVRVLDEQRGIVEFCATSAAIDSYNEVVDPDGCDLSRFQKNSPLIDSHNYGSVANVLGKVNDIRKERGENGTELIATVQFAIDVPENDLARQSFAMVKAGYIKACSIGFIPTQTCQRNDSQFSEVCEDLGLGDLEDSIRCVYRQWTLLELSVCAIGANPDAVARTAARLSPSFSFNLPEPMSNNRFIDRVTRLTSKTTDRLESARRGQSESELIRAADCARLEVSQNRRRAAREITEGWDKDTKRFWNGLPRLAVSAAHPDSGFAREVLEAIQKTIVGVVPDVGMMTGAFPIGIAPDIYDLLPIYWQTVSAPNPPTLATAAASFMPLAN